MSQSRRILREYAKSKGKQAKEFDRINYRLGDYGVNELITKGDNGQHESTELNWETLFHWLTKNYKIEPKNK